MAQTRRGNAAISPRLQGSYAATPRCLEIVDKGFCLLVLTACGLLVPPTRDRTPCSLQLKHGVLTSGPPGSPQKSFIEFFFFSLHLQRLNITETLEVVILKVINTDHTDLEGKERRVSRKKESVHKRNCYYSILCSLV